MTNLQPTSRLFWISTLAVSYGLAFFLALSAAKAAPSTASTRWLEPAPLVLLVGDAAAVDKAAPPEAIIEAQIAAISSADWDTAFGFATRSIQSQFGTPQRFAAMVQGGFAFMIAPASTELSILGLTDSSALVEAVFISEGFGVHRVIYGLERNDDNAWRIAGVLPGEISDLAA